MTLCLIIFSSTVIFKNATRFLPAVVQSLAKIQKFYAAVGSTMPSRRSCHASTADSAAGLRKN